MQQGKAVHQGSSFATYFSQNSSSTLDIFIPNNRATHNIHNTVIRPGPFSTLDHLPVIITITTKAVTEPIPPKVDWKKAHLTNLNTEIEEEMENTEHWYNRKRKRRQHTNKIGNYSVKITLLPTFKKSSTPIEPTALASLTQGWNIVQYHQ